MNEKPKLTAEQTELVEKRRDILEITEELAQAQNSLKAAKKQLAVVNTKYSSEIDAAVKKVCLAIERVNHTIDMYTKQILQVREEDR